MALGDAAGEEAGARNFFNPRRRNPLSPEVEEKWGLPDVLRTWFVNNWMEWEWPADFAVELEKLSTELSTRAIENTIEKNDSCDDEEGREQIKKNS